MKTVTKRFSVTKRIVSRTSVEHLVPEKHLIINGQDFSSLEKRLLEDVKREPN